MMMGHNTGITLSITTMEHDTRITLGKTNNNNGT